MMLALRAKPSWLFELGPRGRSPDAQNEPVRIATGWNEAEPHISTFVLNAFFLSHYIFITTLHGWNCFDKFFISFFYNAVFCTHIGFSFIVFFLLFSKDHSLVLFTAVFYRVMKLLLDASGVQSLLKCVCMKLLCSCFVLNLVCVLVVFRYIRFNWNPNVYVSIALRRMKSGVLHCLSDLIWLRVWRT